MLATSSTAAAPGDISTFAGGGVGDGAAPLNAAVHPGGVAVDSSGNLYFADTTNCRVRLLTTGGVISTIAGTGVCGYGGDGGLATSARLNFPQSVAVSASGEVYVADTANCRIRRVDGGGTITTFAGTGVCVFGGDGGAATSAQIAAPQAVAVSGSDVYIADSDNCRVRRVSSGTITTFAGSAGCGYGGDGGLATSASLSHPGGVTVDTVGNVYIADTNNCRVRVVTPGGTISTVAGTGTCGYTGDGMTAYTSGVNRPQAVTTDAAGDLYIADSDNCRIRKVEYPLVTISTIAGDGDCNIGGDGGPATSAKLRNPAGVAISGADLWIGDSGNCRTRKVIAGAISTAAGTGWCQYGGDGGTATNAAISNPGEVAIDTSGNLYIADTNNCRIRRVTAGGVISTFAGTGTCGYGGDGGLSTAALLDQPRGVAVDSTGAVYIADTNNCRIRRVTSGTITTFAGTGICGYGGDGGAATAGMINLPQSVAVRSPGTIFIADTFNCRVRRVSGGNITTHAGDGTCTYDGDGGPPAAASFTFPYGVAVDSAGLVYIADTFNCRVRKVAGGTVLTIAGTGTCGYNGDLLTGTATDVNRPEGLAVAASGSVYIADSDNCRVRLLVGGYVTTAAGAGACGFGGDGGPATAASLKRPVDVALDAGGNAYVSDTLNRRVRLVATGADLDGDGVANAADNCVAMSNAGQTNSDRDFIDQSPPYGLDDLTLVASDTAGDDCDSDDDNDGLSDSDESSGVACSGTSTNPLLNDTDGDRVVDSAECAIGTDPTATGSKPTPAQCAAHLGVAQGVDTDGDKVRDGVEFCGYASDRLNVNTDGDACSDGKEAASINGDLAVNSTDQLILAQEILRVLGGNTPVANIDMNKDGNTNSADQLFLAQSFGLCVT